MIGNARCQALILYFRLVVSLGAGLMRIAVAVFALVACGPAVVQGAFTDFKDYTQTEAFASGEIFASKELSFKAVQRLAIANPVRIVASSSDGFLLPGSGVEFLLPSGTQEVALQYKDGAGVAIAVNGVEPTYPLPGTPGSPYPAGFGFLDGTSLGGVAITTSLSIDQSSYEIGVLTLRGPIGSLMIAGLELSIDDVTVLVPEPNAVVLILTSATLMMASRRR